MPENTRHEPLVMRAARAEGVWEDWGVGPVHGATSEGRGWWQGEPLTAADVMTANVTTVPRHMPIAQVAELMRRESVGIVPVADSDESLAGVVTDRDIVVRGCAAARPLVEQIAGDVMTTDVECARSDESLVEVVARMTRRRVRRLPVLDAHRRREHRVIGIVSLDDIEGHASKDLAVLAAVEHFARARRRDNNEDATGDVERWSFFPALWRRLRG